MAISKHIKALLAQTDTKQAELLGVLDIKTKQSLSNKFTNERWSADDLVKVADFCGCKLAFVLPNGERIVLGADDNTG